MSSRRRNRLQILREPPAVRPLSRAAPSKERVGARQAGKDREDAFAYRLQAISGDSRDFAATAFFGFLRTRAGAHRQKVEDGTMNKTIVVKLKSIKAALKIARGDSLHELRMLKRRTDALSEIDRLLTEIREEASGANAIHKA